MSSCFDTFLPTKLIIYLLKGAIEFCQIMCLSSWSYSSHGISFTKFEDHLNNIGSLWGWEPSLVNKYTTLWLAHIDHLLTILETQVLTHKYFMPCEFATSFIVTCVSHLHNGWVSSMLGTQNSVLCGFAIWLSSISISKLSVWNIIFNNTLS